MDVIFSWIQVEMSVFFSPLDICIARETMGMLDSGRLGANVGPEGVQNLKYHVLIRIRSIAIDFIKSHVTG
jgi:hypothetical protein